MSRPGTSGSMSDLSEAPPSPRQSMAGPSRPSSPIAARGLRERTRTRHQRDRVTIVQGKKSRQTGNKVDPLGVDSDTILIDPRLEGEDGSAVYDPSHLAEQTGEMSESENDRRTANGNGNVGMDGTGSGQYYPYMSHLAPASSQQQQQQQQPSVLQPARTPQHQQQQPHLMYAQYHHLAQVPARPTSAVSMVLESDDEGDFLPISTQPQGQARADMTRSHSVSYIQSSPYPVPGQMISPYNQVTPLPSHTQHGQPQMLVPVYPTQSPMDGMLFHAPPAPRRPGMPARHSTSAAASGSGMASGSGSGAAQRPNMQRQYSLQPPPQRMNAIANDVFAAAPGSTPVRRSNTFDESQGISPARALGPAPTQPTRFVDSALSTPQTKGITHIPSSATSTAVSESSSGSSSSGTARLGPEDGEDSGSEEADSPTRPSRSTSQSRQTNLASSPEEASSSRPRRTASPPLKPIKPVVCRTSAKLARTAEDPGVEGVPPGPRPMERPTPSFACIIGQAILASSAGGLSLEHIYRYVETAYPFFKTGDGAWRNSVRHNLSIHKMFGTIPRTEKFPPGKGGIWVIHEEEKIHWPSEDKFIKNFPSTHAHHANCRQTLHEKQKETDAMAKAKAEGKEYVPKKGKKGKKVMGGEDGHDMQRTESGMSDGSMSVERMGSQGQHQLQQQQQAMMMPIHHHPHTHPMMMAHPQMLHPQMMHPQMAHSQHAMMMPPPLPHMVGTPGPLQPMQMQQQHPHTMPRHQMVPMRSVSPMPQHVMHHSDLITMQPPPAPRKQMGKDEEFRPVPMHHQHQAGPSGVKRMRDGRLVEEENVFVAPKRPRIDSGPGPLQPLNTLPGQILAQQHAMHLSMDQLGEDAYVTPERERIAAKPTGTSNTSGSSAFKTPALVDTSSSPTSSPMPPTLPRPSSHNPSGLQQAWTHDELLTSPTVNTASSFSLDAAFDIKPKLRKEADQETFWPPALGANGATATLSTSESKIPPPIATTTPSSPPPAVNSAALKQPPKTPLTRSSAAATLTPRHTARTPFSATFKTPMLFAGSPILPNPAGHEMSTPAWELEGILSRLTAGPRSPHRSPTSARGITSTLPLSMRSPLASTDPSRYATLFSSGDGSPKSKSSVSPDSKRGQQEGKESFNRILLPALKEKGKTAPQVEAL